MLINEGGLIRAIKRAYKAGGYTVLNTGNDVAIYTDHWFAMANRSPAAAQGAGHHRGTHGHDPGARYAHVDH